MCVCELLLVEIARSVPNYFIFVLNFYFERIFVVTCQRRTKTRM